MQVNREAPKFWNNLLPLSSG